MANMEGPPPATGSETKSKKSKKKKKQTPEAASANGSVSAPNGTDVQHAEVAEEDDHEEEDAQTHATASPIKESTPSDADTDLNEKFDALAKDRDLLRQEVTELRKSLEDIQGKHDQEFEDVKIKLQEAEQGKEQAETLHKNLKERVNTITASLGERMRANSEEIAQNNARIEELEEHTRSLEDENANLEDTIVKQRKHTEVQSQEIDSLRSRANVTQSSWVKERDDLISREAFAREEYEQARQAMQDWEVLAMEERSRRESLEEQVTDLEDQVASLKDSHERAASERDTQSQTVDNLQRALREIQDARKKELREFVENSEAQLEEVRKAQQEAEEVATAAKSELEKAQREVERALPFEKEVKEKNLLIGKLRHEGVILNDHLTKALRFIKQRNPEDMVDKQVVTNHFIHFITLDRSDPKKFQILQLIAAYLGWTDEQKEQTGLARPGASSTNSSLRIPISPFRRTPSTPSLGPDVPAGSKENLADLWSDFLEREAVGVDGDSSRRPSTASAMTDRG